jgi:hypothetical protein
MEAQYTALRYFALDGTGHATHQEQGSMIPQAPKIRMKKRSLDNPRQVPSTPAN